MCVRFDRRRSLVLIPCPTHNHLQHQQPKTKQGNSPAHTFVRESGVDWSSDSDEEDKARLLRRFVQLMRVGAFGGAI